MRMRLVAGHGASEHPSWEGVFFFMNQLADEAELDDDGATRLAARRAQGSGRTDTLRTGDDEVLLLAATAAAWAAVGWMDAR